jgi:hypothetical protein
VYVQYCVHCVRTVLCALCTYSTVCVVYVQYCVRTVLCRYSTVYVQYCITQLYVFLDFDTIAGQGLFSLRPIHKLKDRHFPGLKKSTLYIGAEIKPEILE